MTLTKPIFIICTGRCGSSIFFKMFAKHPQVAWLSELTARFPHKPKINRWLMRLLDTPGMRSFFERYIIASEGYPFWRHYYRGFNRPFRDLLEEDVTQRCQRKIPAAFEQILTPNRNRLLIKITGWPRIGYLKKVFPDARFIYLTRDWRAVANSMHNVGFWEGWKGPENWRWGPLSEEHDQLWTAHGKSFVALAAIQLKILIKAKERSEAYLDDTNFMQISYEAFCKDPHGMFGKVLSFCDLPYTPGFEKRVHAQSVYNANDGWKRDLTPAQQEILQSVLADELERYGYT